VRLKLDENLGHRATVLFAAAGFDVATVFDQAMSSASDAELDRACQTEERVLVTLDLDFANPLRFDPSAGAGIAVMRVPTSPRRGDIEVVAGVLVAHLRHGQIAGRLWVANDRRVREYDTGRNRQVPGKRGRGRSVRPRSRSLSRKPEARARGGS